MSWNRILFVLALGIAGCAGSKEQAATVRMAPAEKTDLAIRYVASGHVRSKSLRIASPDTGIIAEFPAELNSRVKKGQLLFRLEDSEAKTMLRQLEANLASSRIQWNEAVANQGVQSNQARIQTEQARTQERQAALSVVQAENGARAEERQKMRESLRQSRRGLEANWASLLRQRELYAQDIISPVDMDGAERSYKNDFSGYQQLLADEALQRKGMRQEELDKLRLSQQNARLSSKLAGEQERQSELLAFRSQSNLAQVQSLEAQVERQRYLVERRTVLAPADGTISQRDFEVGETVGANTPVLTLVTNGAYWVEAEVDEQDAAHVVVGQPVRVTLTALPGKTFEAKVAEVSPSLETPPGSPADHKVLRIRVHFLSKFPELRSGLEADVEGQVQLATQVLSVPRASLHRDQGQDFIFTVRDGKLRKVIVKLGAVSSERAEVREGVQPGEGVVVEGGEGLPDGAPVQIAP